MTRNLAVAGSEFLQRNEGYNHKKGLKTDLGTPEFTERTAYMVVKNNLDKTIYKVNAAHILSGGVIEDIPECTLEPGAYSEKILIHYETGFLASLDGWYASFRNKPDGVELFTRPGITCSLTSEDEGGTVELRIFFLDIKGVPQELEVAPAVSSNCVFYFWWVGSSKNETSTHSDISAAS